jgi:protein-disulfide isomerase
MFKKQTKSAKKTVKTNKGSIEKKLSSMIHQDRSETKNEKKVRKIKFPIWGVVAVLLLLVFIAILLYEYIPDFKTNTNNLLNSTGIVKIAGDKNAEKTEPFNFPISVVYNSAETKQKTQIEDHFTKVEDSLGDTKINAVWLDKNSPEGKALIEKTKTKYLPMFVTDESILKHPKYADFSGAIEQLNGVYTIKSEGVDYLEIPKTDNGRVMGASLDQAKVVIIEYASFSCGYCAKMAVIVNEIVKGHAGQVSLVYKNLDRGGPDAVLAQAAECAGDQGKYQQMHDALFANQEELFTILKSTKDANADLKAFVATVAGKAKVNAKTLQTCIDSAKYQQLVVDQSTEARAFGVMGTPSFFINEMFVPGALEKEQFETIVKTNLENSTK